MQARWAWLCEDYRTMASAAQAALELNPSNQQAWEARAQGLTGQGQAATAAAELANAVARNSDLHLSRMRGWAALHGGRYREAEALLAEALKDSPEDVELRLWHAEAAKGRHLWYRPLLQKDLWFERLSPSAQQAWKTGMMVTGLFLFAGLAAVWGLAGGIARTHNRPTLLAPDFAQWVMVGYELLLATCALFASSRTWSNHLLRGRHAPPVREQDEAMLLLAPTLPLLAVLVILALKSSVVR